MNIGIKGTSGSGVKIYPSRVMAKTSAMNVEMKTLKGKVAAEKMAMNQVIQADDLNGWRH